MTITLIGYRGTGKTSVAQPLAKRLGWRHADADEEIEVVAGKSIREIFTDDGEAEFRLLERQVMSKLLQVDQLVIASGGGAVLNADTRREMRAAGPVVWLAASVETILTRIADDQTTAARRPALTSQGVHDEVEAVLDQREPLYREIADVTIDTNGRDINSMVEEIIAAVGSRLQEGAAG